MKKTLLTAFISIASAICILVAGAYLTDCIFPPATVQANLSDDAEVARYLFSHASPGYLIGRLIAGLVAGVAIGMIVSKMKAKKAVAVFVACLFTALCLYYLYLVVVPVWFWLMLCLLFIPGCLIGFKLARK